jgi:hypothetical protein
MHVQEDQLRSPRAWSRSPGPALTTLASPGNSAGAPGAELPTSCFDLSRDRRRLGLTARPRPGRRPSAPTTSRPSSPSWSASATSARCRAAACPTTSEQLLSPLMDALGRAPEMDAAMQALHAMVDILIAGQPDQGRSRCRSRRSTSPPSAARATRAPGTTSPRAAPRRRRRQRRPGLPAGPEPQPANPAVAATFIDTLRAAGDLENAFKVAQFAVENGNEGPPCSRSSAAC